MTRRYLLKSLAISAITSTSSFYAAEALAGRLSLSSGASSNKSSLSKNSLLHSPSDDYFKKMDKFYQEHVGDIFLKGNDLDLMQRCWLKLKRTSEVVGYGNFNILSFDSFLKVCRMYPRIGELTPDELNFLETIFYHDATRYGFYGQRVFKEINHEIPQKEITKLGNTGQHLFRDRAIYLYKELSAHIGSSLIMTSGVRGVPKQLYLFLNKAVRNRGNLSLSSRAIAPPGYSFHGCGDFDIGRIGWGYRNFTKEFETTPEFKELYRLGYVKLRYPFGNLLGVRYEPWHVKTVQTL